MEWSVRERGTRKLTENLTKSRRTLRCSGECVYPLLYPRISPLPSEVLVLFDQTIGRFRVAFESLSLSLSFLSVEKFSMHILSFCSSHYRFYAALPQTVSCVNETGTFLVYISTPLLSSSHLLEKI